MIYYLASPYSSSLKFIREHRYFQAMKATHELLDQNITVFSPIVYCHEMSLRHNRPGDFAHWKKLNFDFLHLCKGLIVLQLNEWKKSRGLISELVEATDKEFPVYYVTMSEIYKGVKIETLRKEPEEDETL